MVFSPGQTAVIVPIPAAEPLVSGWRTRLDPSAAVGVPAHVTVIYPFLPEDELTGIVLGNLLGLIAAHPKFSVAFASCGWFRGVLYLAPSPDEPFRRLTDQMARRWPQAPPYAGAIADPTPHLTIANGATADEARAAEIDVAARLPVTAHIERASLISFDGASWSRRAWLPLGDPGQV